MKKVYIKPQVAMVMMKPQNVLVTLSLIEGPSDPSKPNLSKESLYDEWEEEYYD